MKLSKMIENLEAIKREHGDLDVEFSSIDGMDGKKHLSTIFVDYYIIGEGCVNIVGTQENIVLPAKFKKCSLIYTD